MHYQPEGDALPAGRLVLENFVQRVVSDVVVPGSTDTTPIASLKQALSTIRLQTQIPPLMQNLITQVRSREDRSANAQAAVVMPLDVSTTGIAGAAPTLVDPFTASINIIGLHVLVTYPLADNLFLGTIDLNRISPPLSAPGHTAVVLPSLPLELTLDPRDLITFFGTAAENANVALGPLAPYFADTLTLSDAQIANYSRIQTRVILPMTNSPASCTSGRQADVFNIITSAVVGTRVTLGINSSLLLDEYATDLEFYQYDVLVNVRSDRDCAHAAV